MTRFPVEFVFPFGSIVEDGTIAMLVCGIFEAIVFGGVATALEVAEIAPKEE
ncbi:MAG: hypothetical protein QF910_00720 [Myxococcota bacterium]|nr:hypothetical protein [Myxococcota bacterium]